MHTSKVVIGNVEGAYREENDSRNGKQHYSSRREKHGQRGGSLLSGSASKALHLLTIDLTSEYNAWLSHYRIPVHTAR